MNIRTAEIARSVELNRIHLKKMPVKVFTISIRTIPPWISNHAGVPLIEIVTEPVIRNGEEAAAYLTELRKIITLPCYMRW